MRRRRRRARSLFTCAKPRELRALATRKYIAGANAIGNIAGSDSTYVCIYTIIYHIHLDVLWRHEMRTPHLCRGGQNCMHHQLEYRVCRCYMAKCLCVRRMVSSRSRSPPSARRSQCVCMRVTRHTCHHHLCSSATCAHRGGYKLTATRTGDLRPSSSGIFSVVRLDQHGRSCTPFFH